MRTTLSIDDDIAARLERLRRKGDASFKELINDALRRGLEQIDAPPKKAKPHRTHSSKMGKPLINLDNIAEAIAYAEGDGHK
jgi:hypothetical protein